MEAPHFIHSALGDQKVEARMNIQSVPEDLDSWDDPQGL
jgi:hypothetical protein